LMKFAFHTRFYTLPFMHSIYICIYYIYINIMYTSTTIHAHVYLQTYTCTACTQHTPDISTWRLMEIRGSDACSTSGHGRFDGRSGAAGNRIRRSWALGPVEGWTIGVLG
jgi:hypothetical protein